MYRYFLQSLMYRLSLTLSGTCPFIRVAADLDFPEKMYTLNALNEEGSRAASAFLRNLTPSRSEIQPSGAFRASPVETSY